MDENLLNHGVVRELDKLIAERDALRGENEQQREYIAALCADRDWLRSKIRDWRAAYKKVCAERDILKANALECKRGDMEVLIKENDQLRGDIDILRRVIKALPDPMEIVRLQRLLGD